MTIHKQHHWSFFFFLPSGNEDVPREAEKDLSNPSIGFGFVWDFLGGGGRASSNPSSALK